jgi:hypothetical protein
MQAKIPQFLKREPKILGVVTFKQLLLYGLGLFLSIFFYRIFNFVFFVFFSALTFLIITLYNFGRINNQPIHKVLPDILSFFLLTKRGTWKPVKKKEKKEIVIPEIPEIKEEEKVKEKRKEVPKFERKEEYTKNPYKFFPKPK